MYCAHLISVNLRVFRMMEIKGYKNTFIAQHFIFYLGGQFGEGLVFKGPIRKIYLFGVLRRFQHCTGHITTGSWEGRGNQYIQLIKVL